MSVKICFIIPSLRAGGAERVMSFIAENIDQDHFSSELLIIESEKDKSYDIKKIPVTFLNKRRVRDGIPSILKHLKKNNVDIAVSAMAHVNTMMAIVSLISNHTKFVGRETIVKSAINELRGLPRYPSLLSRLIIILQKRNLDAIICQSEDMRDDLHQNYGFPTQKLFVLNNPITKKFHLKENRTKSPVVRLITIGRLVKQKGYKRILKVLAEFDHPFQYTIVGSGTDQEKIFTYADELGLTDKITHVPFTDNVQHYLENSDLFLQGSYVEGFPNALLEACTVGTPVLAFEAPGGINEIIIEGINGYVANSTNDFLKNLKKAVEKEWSPETINKSVTERYSADIILKKYQDFFLKLNANR